MDSQRPDPGPKLCNLGSTEQNIRLASVTEAVPDPDHAHIASDAAGQARYASVRTRLAIMNALCLAVLCLALDNTILATAIPKITEDFNSMRQMGWYVSAYMLTLSSVTLVYGKLFTYYTIKWVYLTALALFEIGSLVCAVSPHSVALIIGRAVAGIGGSGLLVGSYLIVSVIVPVEKRPVYNSILTGIYSIGGVVGPLLGVGGVTALFLLLFFRADKPCKVPGRAAEQLLELDIVGLALLIPGVVSLFLVLQWGGATYPWANVRIIALLVLFGVLMLTFAAVEYWQQDRATIPPSLIKNRNIWGSMIFGAGTTASLIVLYYYLPIWFQSVKGASATMSGVMNIPLILSVAFTSVLTGWTVTALGYYLPFMYVSIILTSVGAGLLSTFKVDSGHPTWIGFQVLYGLGAGMAFGLPLIVVQVTLPTEKIPIGTALIAFIQTLSGALFNFVGQSVFQTHLLRFLSEEAPGLDADKIADAGAMAIRKIVEPDMVPVVLEAYNSAATHVFIITLTLAAASLLGVLPMRWVSVKAKEAEAESTGPAERL
ncbi:hypothetical protein ASPVEDRAFT_89992 [Aspergillus versicolor CBS 583.65]|uniref:Major facilitator superfamily (MFS) profile domain-containing protein n=1 Tax=Aspergillus versicolor CBS 583.65 TaxID=1036611 RepID=A0A1L9Q4X7_ASPVE|nr:uncharacterized protein ASPVEDRAFT_89992 [Aspergillus versicolor CBS 583.65]OJJ08782.1 hypothetical protein ASPVEDRAFT_89992 [Aspergillus versicolor CBS 583.65]